MTITNVLQGSARGLPPALRTAQEAIQLPEVQAMLRRLSEYHLGIFMPHMHDEQTGDFQPLVDAVTQVESGLAVSFQPTAEIVHQTDRFLPVGWYWRAAIAAPVAVCEMVSEEGPGIPERYGKHKMIRGNQGTSPCKLNF
jgi:hypothetical protein